DVDGSKDVWPPPTISGQTVKPLGTEFDLSAYFSNPDNAITLRGKPGADLGLQKDLVGRSGSVYIASQGDIGGVSNSAAEGPVAYIFVSDVDAVVSKGKSVHFDSAASQLYFSSDSVIDTGSDGDPLVGASVNMPVFRLQGLDANGDEIFVPLSG